MQYTTGQLKEILEKHQEWLNAFEGGERADLSGATLTGADLSGANLSRATLSGADLSGANLDYSCLPLHCGLIGVKIDKHIAVQIAYHFLRMDCEDEEVKAVQADEKIRGLAKQFHRFAECGGLPETGKGAN